MTKSSQKNLASYADFSVFYNVLAEVVFNKFSHFL